VGDDEDEFCSAACRDKDRQIKVKDDDGLVTGCPCKAGYYDSTNIEIHCWEGTRKDDPKLDLLNSKFVRDRFTKDELEGTWKSQCLACPDCIDCSTGSAWKDVKIVGPSPDHPEGFGLFVSEVANATGSKVVVDVFKCPMPGSCTELNFADIFAGTTRSCTEGYDDSSSTPLCGACKVGYSMDGDGCTACDVIRTSSVVVMAALSVAIVVGSAASLRLRFSPHHLQVAAAMLRLMWPRISQSLTLMITNYQIVSGLPDRVGVPFPPVIANLLKAMKTMISIDILNLPGLACVFASDFYLKFISTMLAPLFIVIGLGLLSKWHLKRLRTTTMPMPEDLAVDLDTIGPKGSLVRRQHVARMINFKLCRAVIASKIQAPYYSLMCFIIYLRYPACTRIIFDMFRCRTVAPGYKLLDANYQVQCYEGTHVYFYVVGIVFLVAYTFAIPVFFLYKLTSFKKTILGQPASDDYKPAVGKKGEAGYTPQEGTAMITGNPNYIEIAPFKPMFQFNKASCYKFEIYFWVEKVLLVGFTEMLGTEILGDSTGIIQWLLNLSVTLTFLVIVAVYRPSLEPRYNMGNILMHLVIIYFYVMSMMLNPRVNIHDSAIDRIEFIDYSLVWTQFLLLLYLIWVSFEKLKDMHEKAKVQVVAEREAEAIIKDHLVYFQQLRMHFDDGIAMSLTKMHHKGGIEGAISEAMLVAEQDEAAGKGFEVIDGMDAKIESAMAKAASGETKYQNPLQDAMGGDDDDE